LPRAERPRSGLFGGAVLAEDSLDVLDDRAPADPDHSGRPGFGSQGRNCRATVIGMVRPSIRCSSASAARAAAGSGQ
jgi:hypothetical protein